jgi:hypothetical protein
MCLAVLSIAAIAIGSAGLRDEGFAALLDRIAHEAGRKTAAEVWLRPPGELRAFLDWWIEAGTHHSPALPTPGG